MSMKPARGKTTPASTAGSFTTYAHSAPEIDLGPSQEDRPAKAGAAIGPQTYLIRAANGVPFMAHLVPAGGSYGATGALTAERDMLEFYDARHEHKEVGTTGRRGQFVSRYNVADLLDPRDRVDYPAVGIDLYGGEPSWKIDGTSMAEIRGWLEGTSTNPGPSLSKVAEEHAEAIFDAYQHQVEAQSEQRVPNETLETVPGHFARDGAEYNRFIDDAYEAKRLYTELDNGGPGGEITLADGSRLVVGKDRFIVEPTGPQKGQRLTYKHTSREEAFRQADNLAWTAVLRARGERSTRPRSE